MNNHFSIIMAGGSGTRFWPESTKTLPKQFLDLLGTGKTLLQQSYERVKRFTISENIYVVTGHTMAELVQEQIPELDPKCLIREPIGRNTAPCIGWASFRAIRRNPEAVIGAFPADHLIEKEEEFERVVRYAFGRVEESNAIVTIGIIPSRPETGYGYLEAGEQITSNIRKVLKFVEKPSQQKAEEYFKSGKYFWNAGIFVFKAKRMIAELKEKLPKIYETLKAIDNTFEKGGIEKEYKEAQKLFPDLQGISIDYGVMEKTQGVEMVPGDIGWSDLGSWSSLYEKIPKDKNSNAIRGDAEIITYDSTECLISTKTPKKVALIGLKDMIIVDTNDSLLICPKKRDQEIRKIVENLERKENSASR